MKVTVLPVQTINVRTNQKQQQTVTSTSQFVGSNSVQQEVDQIYMVANNALATANAAYVLATNSLPVTGGEITGNLIVDGTFTADVDGGGF
jgi:hypothetical protein